MFAQTKRKAKNEIKKTKKNKQLTAVPRRLAIKISATRTKALTQMPMKMSRKPMLNRRNVTVRKAKKSGVPPKLSKKGKPWKTYSAWSLDRQPSLIHFCCDLQVRDKRQVTSAERWTTIL